MNDRQRADIGKAVEVITRQLLTNGHGEVIVKIQEGRIVLIKDTVNVRP